MIDEDVPCEDILSQINAAKFALHKDGQVVLKRLSSIASETALNTVMPTKPLRTLPKRLNTLPICTNQKQEQK